VPRLRPPRRGRNDLSDRDPGGRGRAGEPGERGRLGQPGHRVAAASLTGVRVIVVDSPGRAVAGGSTSSGRDVQVMRCAAAQACRRHRRRPGRYGRLGPRSAPRNRAPIPVRAPRPPRSAGRPKPRIHLAALVNPAGAGVGWVGYRLRMCAHIHGEATWPARTAQAGALISCHPAEQRREVSGAGTRPGSRGTGGLGVRMPRP
jgi:hypothetical protein